MQSVGPSFDSGTFYLLARFTQINIITVCTALRLVRDYDWVMEKKAALIEAAISIRVDRSINSSTCKKKLKGGPALAERFDTVSYSC